MTNMITINASRYGRAVLSAIVLLSLVACEPLGEAADRETLASCACRSGEQDLAALRKLIDVVNHTHYGNSFPDVPIRWASGPAEYYAYTSFEDNAIYFVAPNFRQDWDYNFTVVRHEMSHFAVGPKHRHDKVWKREFERLQRNAVRIRFKDVRAGATSR